MLQLVSDNGAGCWHNAWMTALSLALANLKPGTGKTTSAVWLAHVFVQAGNRVLLVDADPSGSALEWSDLAAIYARLVPQQAFRFRVVALPSRELHRRLPEIARDDDVVIIDTPQLEDHTAIARSALRYADEIVIPCAPNPIEINRTTPVARPFGHPAEPLHHQGALGIGCPAGAAGVGV
jgi:chromosome partitioning protein